MSNTKRPEIDQLADEIAATAANIDAAVHALLCCIRRFDELRGWAAQGAASCAHWLSWRLGIGLGTAREQIRVARRLAELPRINAALKTGELSYTKVRAMTRVATQENEELLMHQARGSTGAQLERICAAFARLPEGAKQTDPERRYVRKRTHRDGTMTLEMRLLPDEVDELWVALRETQDRMTSAPEQRPSMADVALHWARLESSAVANAVLDSDGASSEADDVSAEASPESNDELSGANDHQAALTSNKVSMHAKPLLLVHLRPEHLAERPTPDTLSAKKKDTDPWRAELHDGTLLSGHSLQRVACDCSVVAALVDGAGRPLNLGRRRRTVSASLMRALQLRDRGCRFPGCKHRAFTQAHHIQHWSEGGETSEENLILLCHHHHVAVHEGGFRVEVLNRDGTVTYVFYDPEGRVLPTQPPRGACLEPRTFLRKRQTAAGIQARRPVPLWDGTPLDLDAAVSALANSTTVLHDNAEAVFPATNHPAQVG